MRTLETRLAGIEDETRASLRKSRSEWADLQEMCTRLLQRVTKRARRELAAATADAGEAAPPPESDFEREIRLRRGRMNHDQVVGE